MTEAMRGNLANYGTLSLPAGSYIIFYHYTLTNNIITPAATITMGKANNGFAFEPNSFPSYENSQSLWGYNQSLGGNGGTVGSSGSGFFRHNNATNQIVYHNMWLGTSNLVTVFATLQAVRIA